MPLSWARLDPNQLQVLREIARTGSYSAAARVLGYTQPAVSYQMRNLQRAVPAVLMVKAGRSIRLTAAGEALVEHADRILAAISAAERDLAEMAGSNAGRVRIATFPSGFATIVPDALAAIRQAGLQFEIQLFQAEPPNARAMVARGEVDIAVSYRYEDDLHHRKSADKHDPRLARIPLRIDPVRLAIPAGHPMAARERIELADLAGETWILASPQFEQLLSLAASAAGFTATTMLVEDDYVAMQALVARGLGVTLVPELTLAAHTDDGVVTRDLPMWPARHIEVELWPDLMRVNAVATMVEALRTAAERYGGTVASSDAEGTLPRATLGSSARPRSPQTRPAPTNAK